MSDWAFTTACASPCSSSRIQHAVHYLNEGDDEAPRPIEQSLIGPRGVVGQQPVTPPVVLPYKQVVQGLQAGIVVGACLCVPQQRKRE